MSLDLWFPRWEQDFFFFDDFPHHSALSVSSNCCILSRLQFFTVLYTHIDQEQETILPWYRSSKAGKMHCRPIISWSCFSHIPKRIFSVRVASGVKQSLFTWNIIVKISSIFTFSWQLVQNQWLTSEPSLQKVILFLQHIAHRVRSSAYR